MWRAASVSIPKTAETPPARPRVVAAWEKEMESVPASFQKYAVPALVPSAAILVKEKLSSPEPPQKLTSPAPTVMVPLKTSLAAPPAKTPVTRLPPNTSESAAAPPRTVVPKLSVELEAKVSAPAPPTMEPAPNVPSKDTKSAFATEDQRICTRSAIDGGVGNKGVENDTVD